MATHPAALDEDKLLSECFVRRQRRSGPGGQHRNKVETAVVIEHRPSGIRGAASERRSQYENYRVALHRLRVKLAISLRSEAQDAVPFAPSPLWQERCTAAGIFISSQHREFPPLLAEALDVITLCEYDMARAARQLNTTSSQLTKLLKSATGALEQVNESRRDRGMHPLR